LGRAAQPYPAFYHGCFKAPALKQPRFLPLPVKPQRAVSRHPGLLTVNPELQTTNLELQIINLGL
jgi:hypothetical protein